MLTRRPALAAGVALAAGAIVGPLGLRLVQPQLMEDGGPMESAGEIALLMCLFCVGLKLRVPLQWSLWRVPLRLATLTLLATAALAAAAGHLIFDLSLGQSLLLGAILAPTDPVLAADVPATADNEPDGPAFILMAESGINNGLAAALTLVVLASMGLTDSDSAAFGSISLGAACACGGGLIAGCVIGAATARGITLLDPERQVEFLEEAMVFAAALLAYGAAVAIRTNGFLAVFAAGVALCHGGRLRRPLRNRPLMPRVLRIAGRIERLAWLGILVLLGTLLASVELKPRMLVFAAVVLLFVRPLAVRLGLGGIAMPELQWRPVAAFTARGIATVYCLAAALNHGLSAPLARQLAGITLVVVVGSIISSGIWGLPLRRPSPGTVDL
jgi:NhaP-type Na+/H+ or K+/H+ antiporter